MKKGRKRKPAEHKFYLNVGNSVQKMCNFEIASLLGISESELAEAFNYMEQFKEE